MYVTRLSFHPSLLYIYIYSCNNIFGFPHHLSRFVLFFLYSKQLKLAALSHLRWNETERSSSASHFVVVEPPSCLLWRSPVPAVLHVAVVVRRPLLQIRPGEKKKTCINSLWWRMGGVNWGRSERRYLRGGARQHRENADTNRAHRHRGRPRIV